MYRLAAALGSELQRLSDDFGTAALAGLVSQVVRLLELLETLAADGAAGGLGGAAELLLGAPSEEEPPGAGAAERSRQVRRLVRSPAGKAPAFPRVWPRAARLGMAAWPALPRPSPVAARAEGGRSEPAECAPPPRRRWVLSAWRRSKRAVRFFPWQVAEQRLAEAREREQRLQNRLAQLEEEQQRALSCLARGQAQEGEAGPGKV